MTEKKRSLQGRGAAPYSFIWAYEEPENNLEFTSAVELAVQLSAFAAQEVAQILLTTHSPIFYDLAEENPAKITCSHIFRDTDEKGTEASDSASKLDEKMGTMSLLAPRVKQLVKDIREKVESSYVAERLAKENRPKIFVEGESDRIILKRCAKIFHPELADAVDFETKLAGGGHGYVIDMLNGWRSYHKHHTDGPKAAGLLDWDAASDRNEWNGAAGNTASAKCFCYPKPEHAIAAIKAGFRLPVTLEILYPAHVWEWAAKAGHLVDRERGRVFPVELVEKVLRGEAGDYQVDEQYKIYVTKAFDNDNKIKAAKFVAGLSDKVLIKDFGAIGKLLEEVFAYLGLAQTAVPNPQAADTEPGSLVA